MYHGSDLLHIRAIYEAQNADNARTFKVWFDDKLRKVYAKTSSSLSEGDSSVCNYCIPPTW